VIKDVRAGSASGGAAVPGPGGGQELQGRVRPHFLTGNEVHIEAAILKIKDKQFIRVQ